MKGEMLLDAESLSEESYRQGAGTSVRSSVGPNGPAVSVLIGRGTLPLKLLHKDCFWGIFFGAACLSENTLNRNQLQDCNIQDIDRSLLA